MYYRNEFFSEKKYCHLVEHHYQGRSVSLSILYFRRSFNI